MQKPVIYIGPAFILPIPGVKPCSALIQNEQAIFASSYAIPSVEFRYLLEKNSYLAAFFDYAWYERKTVTEYTSDTPFGFGAGLSFQTNAGVFSLFYALGKQFNNPIEFRSGKIHFGFASLF